MNYLLIIEPRQQGKTSLVQRIVAPHVNFVYVYLNPQPNEADWYNMVCTPILRQLHDLIPREQWPTIPQKSLEWRNFLSDLAYRITQAERRLVIILDEIGVVEAQWATEFFSVLRDIFNSRQTEKELQNITFWLVGVYNPNQLIKDNRISPFNIAQRLRLPDFTVEQVETLAQQGGISPVLAQQIHAWTGGQPYLTQKLCSYLIETKNNVEVAIEQLRREDQNHLPPIFQRLQEDKKLGQYIQRIYQGKRIKFSSGDNRHATLELLGLIKADSEGYCIIRNKLYKEMLAELFTGESIPHKSYNSQETLSDIPNNRWAVLVGINQYDDAAAYHPLNFAVNDAVAMQSQLIADDYEPDHIVLLTSDNPESPLLETIENAIKAMVKNAAPHDSILFYFSGHGATNGSERYFIAKDSKQSRLTKTALSLTEIQNYMDRPTGAEKKIIILDTCQTRVDKGTSDIIEAKGLAILSSCEQGQRSFEFAEKKLSVFTYFLLEGLAGEAGGSGVTIEAIDKYVRQQVYDWGTPRGLTAKTKLEPDEHNDALKRIPLSCHSHEQLLQAILLFQDDEQVPLDYSVKLAQIQETAPNVRTFIAEAMKLIRSYADMTIKARFDQLLEPISKGGNGYAPMYGHPTVTSYQGISVRQVIKMSCPNCAHSKLFVKRPNNPIELACPKCKHGIMNPS